MSSYPKFDSIISWLSFEHIISACTSRQKLTGHSASTGKRIHNINVILRRVRCGMHGHTVGCSGTAAELEPERSHQRSEAPLALR
jgi:hypothetical protein